MLLGKLGASLLGNLLTGRGTIAMSHRQIVNKKINKASEGVVRAGEGNNTNF